MRKELSPKIYTSIPYDDLLMFALFSLIQEKMEPTFENLVVECYTLFPKRFGLPGYSNLYPDSAQVDKSWLRCRTDKGLITGDKARGFNLTERGLEVVQRTQKKLGKTNINTKDLLTTKGDRRTKSGRLVKQLEENPAFRVFKKNSSVEGISDYQFCDLIYSTLDALPESRRKNLQQLKDAVGDYGRKDMVDFLVACESKFSRLLFSSAEDNKKYSGGMMKRKLK